MVGWNHPASDDIWRLSIRGQGQKDYAYLDRKKCYNEAKKDRAEWLYCNYWNIRFFKKAYSCWLEG